MHARTWVISAFVLALVAAGLAITALAAWPAPGLRSADAALAVVDLPGYAGSISSVRVELANGSPVPVALRDGRIWPQRKVPAGATLRVQVTVRRPWWAGWLVGRRGQRTFLVHTPVAILRGTWLQVASGDPVTVSFDRPVASVSFDGRPAQGLAHASAVVPTGFTAAGAHAAGTVAVAGAPRLWETPPAAVRVTWFPALPRPQVLTTPRIGASILPTQKLTLTFSKTVASVLGGVTPSVSPAIRGRWQQLDSHTLAFTPSGTGFALGANVQVTLPQSVVVAGNAASALTHTLGWQVPVGSFLRLQQLLAQLGYLPLTWTPHSGGTPHTARDELAAAFTAPPGRFTWRYPNTPPELEQLWSPGQPNTITFAAVMNFEHDSGLAVDGIAGPEVWSHLIADSLAGTPRRSGYSYVFVHRSVPQSLNLWVDGQVILSSPGNTGVPEAPTQLGTYPVFEHISVGTMKGTNPNGSHYNDPGIRWISYFHRGEAIHAFNRASYGTPQSLGCVELPLAAAAKVWPYTPIGTLVTIEN